MHAFPREARAPCGNGRLNRDCVVDGCNGGGREHMLPAPMDGRRGVIDALMEESSLGTGSEAGCVPGLSCPG